MKKQFLNTNMQPTLELRKEIVAKADSHAVNNLSVRKNQLLQHRTETTDTTGGSIPTTISLSTLVLYHN
ncbi:hypothetical protein [Chitinophaga sp. sic0106]|uniref:hypothetical protein n=1 Tax=Chitinophaga sp. sic0106 TaxID=2854785 RepID=UPI001C47473A|nr:hypothetical protein [Chitinophaga sp. sic0106]MBV7533803.1 hypothetical protein [Chitinophaga sp. sic0106]